MAGTSVLMALYHCVGIRFLAKECLYHLTVSDWTSLPGFQRCMLSNRFLPAQVKG